MGATKHEYKKCKQVHKQFAFKQTNKQTTIVAEFYRKFIDITTYIKTTCNDVILPIRHIDCSSFRDQLSINTKNINKQINEIYVNK